MGASSHANSEKYRAQAEQAAAAARKAAEAAAQAAKHAREWAAPRAEQAYRTGARKAKPYVHKVGEKAEHWADVVHGAIVGAAIPAVLSAVDRAAQEDEPRRGGSPWAKVAVPMVVAAAVGAALVVWARRDPNRREWHGDDEWELFSDDGDFPSRLRHDINKTVDLTTDVAKKAAEGVAEVASTVGEKAAPVVAQVKDFTAEQTRRVAKGVESARFKAAEALEDAEDVWEDDIPVTEETPVAKPKRTTKSTAAKKSSSTKADG